MQTRPYDQKDGKRCWLSRDEQAALIDVIDDEKPRRRIALQLGLHGLRSDEIVRVRPKDVRELADGTAMLTVREETKTGTREVPISDDLRQRVKYLKGADPSLSASDVVVDNATRTLRQWINGACDALGDEYGHVGMHDLRRTWATDTFYSLAFEGVPIAEELTMSWGGWKQTSTGIETFRENYLGPVPDHITEQAMELLGE